MSVPAIKKEKEEIDDNQNKKEKEEINEKEEKKEDKSMNSFDSMMLINVFEKSPMNIRAAQKKRSIERLQDQCAVLISNETDVDSNIELENEELIEQSIFPPEELSSISITSEKDYNFLKDNLKFASLHQKKVYFKFDQSIGKLCIFDATQHKEDVVCNICQCPLIHGTNIYMFKCAMLQKYGHEFHYNCAQLYQNIRERNGKAFACPLCKID